MEIFRNIGLLLIIVCFASCDFNNDSQQQSQLQEQLQQTEQKLTEIKQEFTEYRKQAIETANQKMQYEKDLFDIWKKLDDITVDVIVTQINVENNNNVLSTVDRINKEIQSIYRELQTYRSQATDDENNNYIEWINYLIKRNEELQKENENLRAIIEDRDAIIEENKKIKTRQDAIIEQQQRQIANKNAQWFYEMGERLYRISTQEFVESWWGRNKFRQNKRALLNEAQKCFEKAKETGIDVSIYLSNIEVELNKLK